MNGQGSDAQVSSRDLSCQDVASQWTLKPEQGPTELCPLATWTCSSRSHLYVGGYFHTPQDNAGTRIREPDPHIITKYELHHQIPPPISQHCTIYHSAPSSRCSSGVLLPTHAHAHMPLAHFLGVSLAIAICLWSTRPSPTWCSFSGCSEATWPYRDSSGPCGLTRQFQVWAPRATASMTMAKAGPLLAYMVPSCILDRGAPQGHQAFQLPDPHP